MKSAQGKVTAGALLIIAGGLVGAGLALLFAPQSGKKTRRDISRFASRVKDRAEDLVDEFGETVEDLVDTIADRAAELLDQGKDLAHSAKKEVLKALDEGQARLEKEKSRLSKLVG
ncbi:MAG: YtxH domain-containing protein [Desulfuromonadia bacterium]